MCIECDTRCGGGGGGGGTRVFDATGCEMLWYNSGQNVTGKSKANNKQTNNNNKITQKKTRNASTSQSLFAIISVSNVLVSILFAAIIRFDGFQCIGKRQLRNSLTATVSLSQLTWLSTLFLFFLLLVLLLLLSLVSVEKLLRMPGSCQDTRI